MDTRHPVGPYLNGVFPPTAGSFPFPALLSATGAFSDFGSLTPAAAFIPFTVNSPLWSDGAIKIRWMAVPNDGPPYTPDEQIGFAPSGEWTFPNGTVFMKHFELTVNEATGARKRLETRFLVRNAEGAVYGISYKWRPDNSDADLLPDGLEEDIPITDSAGAVRIQRYSYPSRADCLFCHNQQAGYVLGPKTRQLNGDFLYPETGRTAHQLRTLDQLELLNPPPSDPSFASYLRTVAMNHPTAPVQDRMRSWIDSNCSHCHRPGGFGPGYDGRYDTPLANQNLINIYVRFRDLARSQLYQRDNALGPLKMPPLAKNVIHQNAMATLRQWIASPLEILSVTLFEDANHLAVRFNSHVDPATATLASNYALDQGATVSEATLSSEPDTVILSVGALTPNQTYVLTTNEIRDTAPSANTIWPFSRFTFTAQLPPAPVAQRLANISARVSISGGENVAVGGFIVRGGPAKRLAVRALGPSLAARGIQGSLADPVLELYDSAGRVIATNDNWNDNANQQEIIDTGLAPAAATESVILLKLPSNETGVSYTVVLRSATGATGVGLLEIYDLDRGLGPELLNLSTRGVVQTGDNVMIGGLIIAGERSQKVIVRAIGPSLPLTGKLADPTLELVDGQGVTIVSNDNWRSTQESEIMASGVPPTDDREAAIVATLPPAPHTAIVRGKDGSIGVALVEVFALN
ncbi:MAG: hypothetical protein ABIR71_05375 [Chthoniobacterales bacterium]